MLNSRHVFLSMSLALGVSASAQDVDDVFRAPTFLVGEGVIANASSLRSADMNGDGLADIVAGVNGGGVRVLLSNGDLTLGEPMIQTAGANRGVDVADFNGDGFIDVVAGGGTASVAVLLGNGDGTLGPATNIATSLGASQPTAADLNGDGIIDIAVPCRETIRVSILIGQGDGTFVRLPDVGPTGDGAFFLDAGDIDGDDIVDLVVANFDDQSLTFLMGNGTGGFGGAITEATPTTPEDVELVDLDDDGDLDLVYVGFTSVIVREGFDDGTFGPTLELTTEVGASFAEILDVNEDGALDIVATAGLSSVELFLGNGDLTFAPARSFGGDFSCRAITVADLNGDGDVDIVTGGGPSNTVAVLEGDGAGEFSSTHRVGEFPSEMASADFNGDGLADLVAVNATGNSISVLVNRGRMRFEEEDRIFGLTNASFVQTADFDLDGVADIAVATSGFFGGRVSILFGAGDGTFAAPVHTPISNGLTSFAVADLDQVPGPDIVVVRSGGPQATLILFNDGTGAFPGTPTTIVGPFGLAATVAGDWDEDGDVDLAAATNSSISAITLYFNDGTGVFSESSTTPSHGAETRVAVGDANDDGHLDLVTTGTFTGVATVLFGNGDGTFDAPLNSGFLRNPASVGFGDFDNDGVTDLAVAEEVRFFDEGYVSVLFGTGADDFAAPQEVRVGVDPLALVAEDFDGDGVVDVATASTLGRQVTLLASRAGPWNDLGEPLAGALGLPRQVGEGTLQPGEAFRFTLTDAPPSTQAFHIVGASTINAPFKGGTLVPALDFVNPFLTSDAFGDLVIEGPWIGAPSGVTLFFQFWMADSAGVNNFSSSNAISATMP